MKLPLVETYPELLFTLKNSIDEYYIATVEMNSACKDVTDIIHGKWTKFLADKGYVQKIGADIKYTDKFWSWYDAYKDSADDAVRWHMAKWPDDDGISVAAIRLAGYLFQTERIVPSAKNQAELQWYFTGIIRFFGDSYFRKWRTTGFYRVQASFAGA